MNNPYENKTAIKKSWEFLKKDTWASTFVWLVILTILIRFVLFPALSLITGSALPIVVVESCSMYHDSDFDSWWERNSAWYESNDITKEEFEKFPMKNGFTKGDIIFVWGHSKTKKGDIIIFEPENSEAKHPIIHRVVTLAPIGTKGDNNLRQLTEDNNAQKIDETKIPEENIIGQAKLKIPLIGWAKLIFFEYSRSSEQKGFCG